MKYKESKFNKFKAHIGNIILWRIIYYDLVRKKKNYEFLSRVEESSKSTTKAHWKSKNEQRNISRVIFI